MKWAPSGHEVLLVVCNDWGDGTFTAVAISSDYDYIQVGEPEHLGWDDGDVEWLS